MKMKIFTLKNWSLLSKMVLIVNLIVGSSSSAWADDIVIYDEGNSIPSEWSESSPSIISVVDNEIVASGFGYITSSSTFTISNMKLVVVAKSTDRVDSYVGLLDGCSGNFVQKQIMGYGTTPRKSNELYNTEDYIELIFNNYSVEDKNLRFSLKNVKVKSIKFCENKVLKLDEDCPTALAKGGKTETVVFKYSPSTTTAKYWNTICVPFQLKSGSSWEHLTTIFGSNWKAYKLESYSNGVLTFTDAIPYSYSSIQPNVPLLVYAPNATENQNGIELNSNVTITYSDNQGTATVSDSEAEFHGTFSKKTYVANDNWYGVTSDGQVKKAGSGAYVKGYRAYFTGVSAATSRLSIVLDNGGESADLGFVKMVDAEAKDIYNLQGQRVERGNKGIYIVNGKKVILK